MQASSFFLGSHPTPKSVKGLLIFTLLISLLSPVLTYLFSHFFHLPGPGGWLALSLAGLKQGWVWQIATYFFLHSAGTGISFSLLFSLTFHLFLLAFVGSQIARRYGGRWFLLFYLGAGLWAGVVTAGALFFFMSPAVLVGSTPPLFALLMLWVMLYPDIHLFLLFLARFKTKWLLGVLFLLTLMVNLSFGEWISFTANLAGIVWGFAIGRWILKLPNPYPLNLEFSPKKREQKNPGKIIDITVFHEEDDAFMERMLEKISREGEKTLTQRERARMQHISARKRSEE